MNTPSKNRIDTTQTDTNDSMILTPFRGRAIEENELRQAFRMSVTPGLKRRLQAQRSHSSWRSNPSELRLFINDMSESRYSNSGKNLMGQLQMASGEDSEVQKASSNSEQDLSKSNVTTKNIVENSNSTMSNNDLSAELNRNSNKEEENVINNDTKTPNKRLSDLIFSQLKVVPREVKIRKLEPLEIRDVGLKPLTDVNNNYNTNDNTGFIFNNDPLPFEFPRTPPTVRPIYTENNTQHQALDMDVGHTYNSSSIDRHDVPMEIDMDMNNIEDAMNNDIDKHNNDMDIIDHEYERSFTFGQNTPHLANAEDQVFTYSDKNKDTNDDNDKRDVGGETIDMVTKIRHLLIRSDGTFESDFDKIITFLNNNQMIMNDSMPSINDIFEICCQYLDMSEINEIERVWFYYK